MSDPRIPFFDDLASHPVNPCLSEDWRWDDELAYMDKLDREAGFIRFNPSDPDVIEKVAKAWNDFDFGTTWEDMPAAFEYLRVRDRKRAANYLALVAAALAATPGDSNGT